MSKLNTLLLNSLLTVCLAGLLTPVLAQQTQPSTSSQPATGPGGRGGGGGGGGRGPSIPGMTGAERDAFIGVTTKNTYTPMPKMDATGKLVPQEPVGVKALTDDLYQTYGDSRGGTFVPLSRFYTKCLKINGVMVVGSPRVSDYAFLEAAYTLDHQFHDSPQWVKDVFERLKIRLAILSVVEFTMDLPENNSRGQNADLANALYQDGRSRGLGGMPWCSCAEENLLNLRGDRYGGPNGLQGEGENITIHEFSHTTASAIRATQATYTTDANGQRTRVEGPWGKNMDAAYAKAMAPGGRLYVYNQALAARRGGGRGGAGGGAGAGGGGGAAATGPGGAAATGPGGAAGTGPAGAAGAGRAGGRGGAGGGGGVYASNTWQEYWAEAAQAWFDNANPGNSGGLSVRADVKTKDPDLAAILAETYGDAEWRYFKTSAKNPDGTTMRPAAELAHLAGIDELRGNKIPNFNNNNSPRVQAAATQPNLARRGGGGGAGGGAGGGRRGGGTQPAAGASTLPAVGG